MLLRGVAIGALPWLSTKYAPMAAVVTIVLLLRARWNPRAAAALLAPITLVLAGWFAFFFWIWGTVSPSAPYGSSEPMTLGSLARGAPGLLFDQEYGVAAYAPILASRVRRGGADASRRRCGSAPGAGTDASSLARCCARSAASICGGEAPRLRAGPSPRGCCCLACRSHRSMPSTASRPSARAGCPRVAGVEPRDRVCAGRSRKRGALLNNDRDGSAALLEWASPTWPVSSAFPSFIAGSWAGAIARTFAWLALGAGRRLAGACASVPIDLAPPR